MPNFRLQTRFLIGTFGSDYLNQINCDIIYNNIISKLNKKGKRLWDVLVVKAHGDDEIDHDHYHFFCYYLGSGRCSITSEKYFDIKLPIPIYANYKSKNEDYITGYSYNELLLEGSVRNKLIKFAHPNFKGPNKKNKNSEYNMLNYVYKQKIEHKSSFDVDSKLLELIKNIDNKKNNKKEEKNKLKDELCNFIVHHWQISTPKEILIEKILKKSEYRSIYIQNSSIQNFVNTQYNKTKLASPIPIFGKYWIPIELKEYLDYLNDYIKNYYEEVIIPCKEDKYDNYDEAMEKFCQNHKERGKTIVIKGKGGIGKTHLFACFGPCSYWKDRFNFDQWNPLGAFNWFDDLDVYGKSPDSLNNGVITATDWEYLKTWIGGQYHATFSGKYRSVKTVINYKPCVFITNSDINERFNETALKYMKEIGVKFINLDYKLYEKPNRLTIGGFCKYVEYDTTKTYYYQNIYDKKNEESDSSTEIVEENPTEIFDEEMTPTEIIDFISEDEVPCASTNVGRPKRKNFFQNFLDNLTENRRKKPRSL